MCDTVCILQNIKLLASNFNKKFTAHEVQEKVDLFYDFLKGRNNKEINDATRNLISEGTIKYFPDVSDMKRYLAVNKLSESVEEFCKFCEKTGYYTIWQFRENLNKYYPFAYACACNKSKHGLTIIDARAIPARAHNLFPPDDTRHDDFNNQKKPWDYQRLDKETFQALAYSYKMKNVLKSVN